MSKQTFETLYLPLSMPKNTSELRPQTKRIQHIPCVLQLPSEGFQVGLYGIDCAHDPLVLTPRSHRTRAMNQLTLNPFLSRTWLREPNPN